MHPQGSNTDITTPTESNLDSVATILREHLLRDWDVADIKSGIKQVRQTEVGIVREVFVSPGLFGTLCHYKYGNRTRKPFSVVGIRVKQWRPDFNGVWRKDRRGK